MQSFLIFCVVTALCVAGNNVDRNEISKRHIEMDSFYDDDIDFDKKHSFRHPKLMEDGEKAKMFRQNFKINMIENAKAQKHEIYKLDTGKNHHKIYTNAYKPALMLFNPGLRHNRRAFEPTDLKDEEKDDSNMKKAAMQLNDQLNKLLSEGTEQYVPEADNNAEDDTPDSQF